MGNNNLRALPKLRDSISYIYAEHAVIEQDEFSIVMICADGKIPIPVSSTTSERKWRNPRLQCTD